MDLESSGAVGFDLGLPPQVQTGIVKLKSDNATNAKRHEAEIICMYTN